MKVKDDMKERGARFETYKNINKILNNKKTVLQWVRIPMAAREAYVGRPRGFGMLPFVFILIGSDSLEASATFCASLIRSRAMLLWTCVKKLPSSPCSSWA